jgi:hypothetical protein
MAIMPCCGGCCYWKYENVTFDGVGPYDMANADDAVVALGTANRGLCGCTPLASFVADLNHFYWFRQEIEAESMEPYLCRPDAMQVFVIESSGPDPVEVIWAQFPGWEGTPGNDPVYGGQLIVEWVPLLMEQFLGFPKVLRQPNPADCSKFCHEEAAIFRTAWGLRYYTDDLPGGRKYFRPVGATGCDLPTLDVFSVSSLYSSDSWEETDSKYQIFCCVNPYKLRKITCWRRVAAVPGWTMALDCTECYVDGVRVLDCSIVNALVPTSDNGGLTGVPWPPAIDTTWHFLEDTPPNNVFGYLGDYYVVEYDLRYTCEEGEPQTRDCDTPPLGEPEAP